MNSSIKRSLVEIPFYDENEVITTTLDGRPLSCIFGMKWDFSGIEKRAVGKSQFVSFKAIDKLYCKGIQSTLAFLFKEFKLKHQIAPSKSQVEDWKKGLVHIAQVQNGCTWGALSDDMQYRIFKASFTRHCQRKNLSKSSLSNIIKALNKLNEFNLCSRLFSLKELTSSINIKERQQHIAIPIGMYKPLISEAISVVEAYHPFRSEIPQVMLQAEEIRNSEIIRAANTIGNSAITQRVQSKCKSIQHNIPNFKIRFDGFEISRILNNCALVILAFSGARVSEVISFSKDSYKEKLDGSDKRIPILEGETSKGSDGLPVTESWQTHPIAKDALELAYDMTEHLRDISKNKVEKQFENKEISKENYEHALREIRGAFISVDPTKVISIYSLSGLDEKLNLLMTKSGIIATQSDVEEFDRLNPSRIGQLKIGGTLPKLSPHDFRRTFAVFFRRYGFGTASSIKFQYKHQNINMSDYYANNARLQAMEDILMDNELLALMNEEGIRMGVDIFDEIFNESEKLSGAGGDRIAQNRFQKLNSGHQVYMSRVEIESLVRNGTLSVVKLPTGGYCLNATCSRVCGIGQFSGEIKPCDHQVITDKEAKIILRQNKRLIKSFREMNVGDPMEQSILVGMKQKIKRNEVTIKKHTLKYEEFNDAVKVIIAIQEA